MVTRYPIKSIYMFAALLERRIQVNVYSQFQMSTCSAQGDNKSIKKMERSLKPDG